ncbi:hypothetical protein SASPL_147551 [Salvia splendens]|uniref:Probable purine permease n=1 Tax=Salvia splendens TaxID=180675 RepID=A0A8X8Z5X6_SALSN|nr:hypothetical protein SASPL_147551 [Salvia splendens]
MTDNQVPMLANGGYRQRFTGLIDLNGGFSWVETVNGWPLLSKLVPYLFLRSPDKSSSSLSAPPPPTRVMALIYIVGGAIIAGDNMLYSIGLLYLSASTYSLICATQLAFNALFAFFINQQNASRGEYILGVLTTLAASALYSLVLSPLMQLTFEKVQKRETFSAVLDMQVYTSIVATCVTVVGLFASGEWGTIRGEMEGIGSGEACYIMTLVWTAVAWQISSVGVVGLIFVVSSLFSNAISTLSTTVTPIASLVVFHDKMNGPKIVAMLLAFLGFALYIRQNYLDDLEARKKQQSEECDEFVQ